MCHIIGGLQNDLGNVVGNWQFVLMYLEVVLAKKIFQGIDAEMQIWFFFHLLNAAANEMNSNSLKTGNLNKSKKSSQRPSQRGSTLKGHYPQGLKSALSDLTSYFFQKLFPMKQILLHNFHI